MKDELNRLRDDVLTLFPRLEAELGEDLAAAGRDVLSRGRAALADSHYQVVICGEFKRGKSRLLNTLVGQRIFPVDMDVTTATVCTLAWGPAPSARVHLVVDDDGTAETRTIELSELGRYGTEQGRRRDDPPVARIDVVAPIPQLESGLVLVDTPGCGSMNPAHTAATRGFLPEADALLFVASSVQPLGTVELAFLAHAYEVCPLVLTAVTMIDKTTDERAVIAQARTRIADVTGTTPEAVDLVGVSAVRYANGRQTEDAALVAESGIPVLEERLWTGLAGSAAMARLGRALDVMESVVADSQAPLQNERAGLADQNALKDLDQQLKAAQAQAREARADVPRRSRMLAEELEERSRPLRRELAQTFEELHGSFLQATEDRTILAAPGEMIQQLVNRMVDAQAAANRQLKNLIDEVAASHSDSLPIQLTGTGIETTGASIVLSAPRIDLPTRRFASFRTVWTGATAAGAAGLVAGTVAALVFPPAALPIAGFVAGPLIGGLLGQLGGVVGGLGQARLQNREREDAERRRRLRDYVLPHIDSARRRSQDDLTQRLRDEIKAMIRAMEEQLVAAAESLELSRARLQDAWARTTAENAARLRQVESRLLAYDAMFRRVAELRLRVDDLAETGTGG